MKDFTSKWCGMVFVAIAGSCWAQSDLQAPAGSAPPLQARPSQPGQRPGLGGLGPGIDFRVMSVLTPEQRESLQSAVQSKRAQAQQLEERLRTARKVFMEVGLSGKFDEKEIREKAKAVGDAEAELAVFRARTLSEMKPPLTPEQIAKLHEPLKSNERTAPQLPRAGLRSGIHSLTNPAAGDGSGAGKAPVGK